MFGMLYLNLVWIALGHSAASSGAASAARPIAEARAVLAEDFECECGPVHTQLLSDPHVRTAAGEGVGGGNALRVTYAGGERGSAHVSRSFRLPSAIEYTLNYDVKFGEDFQFVKGGKLHGLAPDRPVSGGQAAGPANWSARVMWRGNGKLGTYTYNQKQRGRYGDRGRVLSAFTPKKGTYYAVSLHVRLNQPAHLSNGFVRLFVDGKLVEADEGLQFRSVEGPDTLISRFAFTTFHGGHDPSWAPRTSDGRYANVHAFFDNVVVHAGERIRQAPGR